MAQNYTGQRERLMLDICGFDAAFPGLFHLMQFAKACKKDRVERLSFFADLQLENNFNLSDLEFSHLMHLAHWFFELEANDHGQ